VRVRSSLYACALPVRPVRSFKAVLLEYSLKWKLSLHIYFRNIKNKTKNTAWRLYVSQLKTTKFILKLQKQKQDSI